MTALLSGTEESTGTMKYNLFHTSNSVAHYATKCTKQAATHAAAAPAP